MTRDTGLLNDNELATVAGGGTLTLIATTGTLVLPHIPRDSEMLTPQQIQKLITPSFNPPITLG
jgi:hypothetical protein